MVNPRWRPKIANSRIPDGKQNEENRKISIAVAVVIIILIAAAL